MLLIHLTGLPTFSFKKYFIRIGKLYISIVLVNIRNIYVKHSQCGPIYIQEYCYRQINCLFKIIRKHLMNIHNYDIADYNYKLKGENLESNIQLGIGFLPLKAKNYILYLAGQDK